MSDPLEPTPPIAPDSSAPSSTTPTPLAEWGDRLAASMAETLGAERLKHQQNPRRQAFRRLLGRGRTITHLRRVK